MKSTITLALLLVTAASGAAPAANLITNGGFEVVAPDGKPTGWDCRSAVCQVVTADSLAGERCLEMLPR